MTLNLMRKSPCSVSDSLSEAGIPLATEGETLRWMRGVLRLPQKVMAARAGFAEGTLSEIENDLARPKKEQLECVHGAALLEMATLMEGFALALREIQRRRIA